MVPPEEQIRDNAGGSTDLPRAASSAGLLEAGAEPILGRIAGVTSGPGLCLTGSVTFLTVPPTWWPRCPGLAKLVKPKQSE
ncbi:hypothetical protein Q3G72_035262 [Acer saccharum]|nr:hypothetical protein Q3G72_035262 [Acer saccharum]